ncbi:hypothetical protein [Nocardioides alcanivorans]|uniref:hypothetical protein n=1 Tax=Nocardioides alcanivorans TaxID=2897352 RepID=UPI001F44B2AA|nr:hypothetical protein [Nocardioides alcanivorans]
MSLRGVVDADEMVAGLVVFTVYARSDLGVCSRVLQVLALRQARVECFVADCTTFDHTLVRGLTDVSGDVMRLSVVVSIDGDSELDQLTKYLNRVVDVYKVEHDFRI